MLRVLARMALLALSAIALGACDRPDIEAEPTAPSGASALSAPPRTIAEPLAGEPLPKGDPALGRTLVEQHECNRCHDGTGLEPTAMEKHCFHCHERILTGIVHAAPATLAKWRRTVAPLRAAPSLQNATARYTRTWLEAYLVEPHDLRPQMPATMPRLGLGAEHARHIVAYLTTLESAPKASAAAEGPEGRLTTGKRLFEDKGCTGCHAFSGANVGTPPEAPSGVDARAFLLAPDLRFTRRRYQSEALVDWLLDPRGQKNDTLMPNHALTAQDARDLARFVTETALAPEPTRPPVRRLPPFERRVAYAEVQKRVLGVTCGHCHGNPDAAFGDGGPGNTGGFGFPARGLDLTSYGKVASGWIDGEGHRRSVFEPLPDGTPRLVASLLARHEEVAGRPNPAVRGMPLGLPPVALEDIRLVDTWISQGRPR